MITRRAFARSIAHAFRRTAVPLAAYYAVTLALPLANGAAASGSFGRHALVVLVVPPIGIVLGWALHTIVHHALRRQPEVERLRARQRLVTESRQRAAAS